MYDETSTSPVSVYIVMLIVTPLNLLGVQFVPLNSTPVHDRINAYLCVRSAPPCFLFAQGVLLCQWRPVKGGGKVWNIRERAHLPIPVGLSHWYTARRLIPFICLVTALGQCSLSNEIPLYCSLRKELQWTCEKTDVGFFSFFLFTKLIMNPFCNERTIHREESQKKSFPTVVQFPHLHLSFSHLQFSHLHPSFPHPLSKNNHNSPHRAMTSSLMNSLEALHWQLESQVHLPDFVQSSLQAHFPAKESTNTHHCQ